MPEHKEQILTFVELNCENLFDTRHDTLKNDVDFLPDGKYRWTPYRYWKKLNAIGKEIIGCGDTAGGWTMPDLVALVEVENDSVLFDLTRRSLLRSARYEYVMTNSPDERGVDVALLYSPFSFSLLSSSSLRVEPPRGLRPTRDILYASGLTIGGDTLHVFVVHAPSRAQGEGPTRRYRMRVAERIGEAVDSRCDTSPSAGCGRCPTVPRARTELAAPIAIVATGAASIIYLFRLRWMKYSLIARFTTLPTSSLPTNSTAAVSQPAPFSVRATLAERATTCPLSHASVSASAGDHLLLRKYKAFVLSVHDPCTLSTAFMYSQCKALVLGYDKC